MLRGDGRGSDDDASRARGCTCVCVCRCVGVDAGVFCVLFCLVWFALDWLFVGCFS